MPHLRHALLALALLASLAAATEETPLVPEPSAATVTAAVTASGSGTVETALPPETLPAPDAAAAEAAGDETADEGSSVPEDEGSSVAADDGDAGGDEFDLDLPPPTISGIDLSRASPENREKIRELLRDFRANSARSGVAYARYTLGRIHALTGDFKQARRSMRFVIERHPGSRWALPAREALAEFHVLEDNLDDAIAEYEKILKDAPLTDRRRKDIYLRMARIYGTRLTSFERILEAYRRIAARPEYNRERVIRYLGGFFKGYHLLKSHFAVKYYDLLAKKYPDEPEADEARLRLGMIFGYDLSDDARALRHFGEVIRSPRATDGERRRATLMSALLEQFRPGRTTDYAAFPFHYALLDAGGTDEIRATAVFYLARMFEEAAQKGAPEPAGTAAAPDLSGTDPVALKRMLFDRRIPPERKAFELHVENLARSGDAHYAGLSAVRLASILAFREGRTAPIELVERALAARFPESPWLAEIDRVRAYALPRFYDPAFTQAFSRATRLYEEGEYEQAIAVLQAVVDAGDEGPEAEWAHFTITRIVEEDLRDDAKAIERYRDFLARFPRSSRRDKVRYQIARIYEVNLLDYHRAQELYQEIVEDSDEQMWIFQATLNLAALARDVFNKPGDAEKIYGKALDRVPARRDELLYRIAKSRGEAKEPRKRAEALDLYREIVDESPQSPFFDEALQALVDARLRDRLSDLDAKIQRGGENTAEVAALLERKLEQQLRLKDHEEAARTLDAMIAKSPGTAEAALLMLRKAKALAQVKDKAVDAIRVAATALESTEDPAARADALFFIGQTHELKTLDWVRAREVYDLLLKEAPDGAVRMNALYRRGVIAALKDKDLDRAYELYRELITRYGEEAKAAGLLDRIQNLLRTDLTRILLTGDTEAARAALADPDEAADSAEVLLDGASATLESAAPAQLRTYGPWFRPVRVERAREGDSWFAGSYAADPGTFWVRRDAARGWFARGKTRDDRDPDELDAEEIARQEAFLEKLTFESNPPPVESPQSVYYLDWLARNPKGEKTPIVLLALARSFERSGDLTRALDALTRLLADHADAPEAARAEAARATIRARSGDFAAAQEGLEEARRAGRIDAATLETAQRTVAALEKVRGAEAYVNANPGDPRSLELLAESARLQEKDLADPEAAIAALHRAAAFTAGETEEVGFRREIIRLALARKDLETADEEYLDLLARFRELPEFADLLYEYAKFLADRRKTPKEALPYLREIRDRHADSPRHGEALAMLAEILPEEDLSERRAVFRSLLDAAPDMTLRAKFAESIRLLDTREKIAEIRALIRRKTEGCATHRGRANKGCSTCSALAGNAADSLTAREPEIFAWYKYVARLEERELGDRKAAIETLQEMVALRPPPAMKKEALLKLGDLLGADGRHLEAAEMFRREALAGFDHDPGFAAYLQFLCARAFEEGGKFEEAREEYRKTSLFFPFSEWANTARLALATFDERVRDAREERQRKAELERKKFDFELSGEKIGTAEVATTGEVAVKRAEKPEERLEQIYEIVERDPKAPEAARLLLEAASLERRLNRPDRMVEAWKRLLENFPQHPDFYNIVFLMAEEYKRAGNFSEAIPFYKRIYDEQPQFNRTEYVQHTLGKLYAQTGDFLYALDVFRQLIDRYQDHEYAKDAQFEVAVIRERELREYDEAIREYRKMADRYFDHPRAVDALVAVGRIYETVRNDYAAARDAYQEALDKFPNTPNRREITFAIERVTRLIR